VSLDCLRANIKLFADPIIRSTLCHETQDISFAFSKTVQLAPDTLLREQLRNDFGVNNAFSFDNPRQGAAQRFWVGNSILD